MAGSLPVRRITSFQPSGAYAHLFLLAKRELLFCASSSATGITPGGACSRLSSRISASWCRLCGCCFGRPPLWLLSFAAVVDAGVVRIAQRPGAQARVTSAVPGVVCAGHVDDRILPAEDAPPAILRDEASCVSDYTGALARPAGCPAAVLPSIARGHRRRLGSRLVA